MPLYISYYGSFISKHNFTSLTQILKSTVHPTLLPWVGPLTCAVRELLPREFREDSLQVEMFNFERLSSVHFLAREQDF